MQTFVVPRMFGPVCLLFLCSFGVVVFMSFFVFFFSCWYSDDTLCFVFFHWFLHMLCSFLVLFSLANDFSNSDNAKLLQAVTLTCTPFTARHGIRRKYDQSFLAQSEVALDRPDISLTMNLAIATWTVTITIAGCKRPMHAYAYSPETKQSKTSTCTESSAFAFSDPVPYGPNQHVANLLRWYVR